MKETSKYSASQELLTKQELAKKLKCSTRKIEMDPDLPKVVWGRLVRYDWAKVCTYLES